jgi:hypothetical protein
MGFASHKDARQSIFLRKFLCRFKKKFVTFFFSFFFIVYVCVWTWICWLKCAIEVLYILFWTLTCKYNLNGYIYCLLNLNVEYVWMFIYLFFYTRLYTSFFKIEFELKQHRSPEWVCVCAVGFKFFFLVSLNKIDQILTNITILLG